MRTVPFAMAAIAVVLLAGCGGIRFMKQAQAAPATPPAGKSLVNFIRPSAWGGAEDLPLFDGHRLIGNVEGKMICPYVCEPGEHWFIANKGHVSVVRAELLPDRVYDVLVDARPGAWSLNVSLDPVTKSAERRGRIGEWDSLPRYEFVRDGDAEGFEAKRKESIDRILAGFRDGEKKDRVRALAKDDHR